MPCVFMQSSASFGTPTTMLTLPMTMIDFGDDDANSLIHPFIARLVSLPSQDAITEIVNGLFSVLVTLGVVPVIRCPTGDAAGALPALD